jgi:hypothetical protein
MATLRRVRLAARGDVQRTLGETEQIGLGTLDSLQAQRETLLRAGDNVRGGIFSPMF